MAPAAYTGKITGDWEIVGFGDFNGDGTDDIIFYSGTADTYKTTAWTIQDGAVTGIIALS